MSISPETLQISQLESDAGSSRSSHLILDLLAAHPFPGQAAFSYSQVPNKHPPLFTFSIFSKPRTFVGPPFINFKEIGFFYKPLISFPFFISNIDTLFFMAKLRIALYIFVLCFMTTCYFGPCIFI